MSATVTRPQVPAFLLIVAALLLVPASGQAAKPAGLPEDRPRGDALVGDPLVIRIQTALASEGLYHGPIDGRVGPDLETAVRRYQRRSGIAEDGRISEDLANLIETASQVRVLIQRLESARSRQLESARQALLSNPATRHLLTEPDKTEPEIADPTRDPTPCFRAPTPACLLDEAVESSKKVARDELRFWALGELLAAQVKAGFAEDATETLRRIGDPRLVMRALRDIAVAQADAARLDDALAAAEIIPDPVKRTEALTAIAATHVAHPGEAAATLQRATRALDGVGAPNRRVALLTEMAVIRHKSGDGAGALNALSEAEAIARRPENRPKRDAALRRIAAALADIGRPDAALSLVGDLGDDSERTSVLIAAALAQARAGRADKALETAAAIDTHRYRPGVLARAAVAQARNGAVDAAGKTLDRALTEAEAIEFPYARAFAQSRVVLAMIDIAQSSPETSLADIRRAADRIEDPRLRGEALWRLTVLAHRRGQADEENAAADAARAAVTDIRSRLSKIWMLADLTLSWLAEGNREAARAAFADAVAVVETMGNAWARARALARLAAVLVDLDGTESP